MRRRYKRLIGLLLLVGLPYYWLLIDNRPGSAPARPIDIARLRALAEAIPGARPDTVIVHLVGWRRVPGTLLVAGGGLKRHLVAIDAFVLRGPWGDIAIDSGLGRADAERMGLDSFLPGRQAKVDAGLRAARLIVFTHEHPDHINGLLRLPDFAAVAKKALITPEQGPAGKLAADLAWPAGSAARVEPFRYSGMAAIAPGVVLVRTPGHTPGSQMIYARLADGEEYLFAGDTATMARSWRELRARSRLMADWLAPEDRTAVYGWLKGIRALKRAAPRVHVVPGHDFEHLAQTAGQHGILIEGEPRPRREAAD